MINYPKVSIIILNWNGWKDTIECLESIFRIDYPNYQVVVIDNGSTDSSVERMKAWAEGKQEVLTPEPSHPLYHLSHPPVQKPIPYIEYDRKIAEAGGLPEEEKKMHNKLPKGIPCPLVLIQTGDNLGFAGGNNVGIKYAMKRGSTYIWLLNNDAVVEINSLTNLVKTVTKNNSIAMVGSKIYSYTNHETIQMAGGGKLYVFLGTAKNIEAGKEDKKEIVNKLIEPDYIGGASVLASIDVIKIIGLMDEKYFMYLEDLEWGLRAKKAGFSLAYCPYSKVWHKGGASCKGFVKRKFFWKQKTRSTLDRFLMDLYGYRNWVYLYKKYFPYLIPLLSLRLLYKGVEILLYDNYKLVREKLMLRAIWDGLKGNMGAIKHD